MLHLSKKASDYFESMMYKVAKALGGVLSISKTWLEVLGSGSTETVLGWVG